MEDPIEGLELANYIATVALEKKARDVVILDMRGLVHYTDFFVLCTARNTRHVEAIAEEARAMLKSEHGMMAQGTEGREAGRWVLVDFSDVVLHVFGEQWRGFYDLDGLWQDAPRIEPPEVEVEDDDEAEPFFSLP